MPKNPNLPFAMTTEAVSAWLSQISKLDAVQASHELYSVLRKLGQIETETADLYSALVQLTPSALHLSGSLTTLLLASLNNDGTVSRKSRKLARLNSQLIRTLSLAYCHAVTDQDLTKKQKAQAIFTVFQLIGLSLKTHTLISERPSTTLWIKMGELYLLAVEEGLTAEPLAQKIPLFKNQKTIISALKRNLLYALFDLYRIPPDQLANFYDAADRCVDKLALSKNTNTSFNFYWDIASSRFPQQRSLTKEGQVLAFNTASVVDCLRDHMQECDRKNPIFNAVWQKLNGYWEIIDSVIPSKPLLYHLETGLTSTIDQLKRCNRLSNIYRLSAQLPEPVALGALELVPLEHEKQGYQTRWEQTLQQHAKNLKTGMAYLLPAKNPQFFLTQVKSEPLPDNLPVLLYTDQISPIFGVIRFNQTKPETDNQTALIETLPGTLSVVSIKLQTVNTEAILIKQSSGQDGLILAPGKYKTGDTIERSDQPDRVFQLSRLIEVNDQFMFYLLAAD
ncbi:MAG: hypothetical protein ACU83N_11145 [Gammaproteobacteria bacterium]